MTLAGETITRIENSGLYNFDGQIWDRVRLADGRQGFVQRRYLKTKTEENNNTTNGDNTTIRNELTEESNKNEISDDNKISEENTITNGNKIEEGNITGNEGNGKEENKIGSEK